MSCVSLKEDDPRAPTGEGGEGGPACLFGVTMGARAPCELEARPLLADYCAFPSGSDNKLISDFQDIEKSFYTHLRNIYQSLEISSQRELATFIELWRRPQ
jgi:hypothetical protein